MPSPKVTLVMAMSADGFITKHTDGLVNWTSKEDKQHFSEITQSCGALVYGNATFKTFNKPLPGRLNVVMTRTPDTSLNQADVLEFTSAPPQEILSDLAQRGFDHVALGGGAQINKLFLEQGLVDELMITIEPKLFGSGMCLIGESQLDISLKFIEMTKLNDDAIVLRYSVN